MSQLALLIALAVPVAAAATLLGHARWPRATAWGNVAAAGGQFVLFCALARDGVAGTAQVTSLPWVPQLGVTFTLRLDGLSLAYALLVTGIGALVLAYSIGYLGYGARLARVLALLQVFSASMLGLVLADDAIAMFVFWELTGVWSFFLIGAGSSPHAWSRARQALVVTTAGGFALLIGLLLLAGVGSGSPGASLSASLAQLDGGDLRSRSTYAAIVALVAIGAFAKSAQVPLHFWLPGAMVAPTPVSAYLHSATMVQAGVYLLARLHPALGQTVLWSLLLGLVGGTTLVTGGVLALRQRDLKLTLAYSTVAILGASTLLIGVGTDEALAALAMLIVAHAVYKAALFLVVGNVEHHTGSRDSGELRGLARVLPVTATSAWLAAFSMAGVPLVAGFMAKEGMYLAAATGPAPFAGVAAALVGGTTLVAAAWVVGHGPFAGGGRGPVGRDVAAPMLAGPLVLAIVGVVLGLAPSIHAPLAAAVASTVGDRPVPVPTAAWHGVDGVHGLVLLLGGLSFALGTVVFRWLRARARSAAMRPAPIGERVFEIGLNGVHRAARGVATALLSGGVRRHTAVIFAGAAVVSAWAWAVDTRPWPVPPVAERWYEAALAGLAAAGAIAAAIVRDRLAAVATLGASGLAVSFLFASFSAPDLAITQLIVETVMVIVLVLAFRRLPPAPRVPSSLHRPVVSAVIAGSVGASMSALLIATSATARHPASAAAAQIAEAPGQHSTNVVNAILVNFRALDTLGEVTVIAIAGLGVVALFARRRQQEGTCDR